MHSSTELGIKYFIATQVDGKIKRESKDMNDIEQLHIEVEEKVRKTIEELGGTMPENLSVPEKSIKTIETEQQKQLRAGDEE